MNFLKFYSYTILLNTALICSCNELKNPCNLAEYYSLQFGGIQFTECGTGKGQTTLYSKYILNGKQSHQLEEQLVKKHGMGELTFTCCGWEPKNGKKGIIYIDPKDSNRILSLNLWGKPFDLDSFTKNKSFKFSDKDSFFLEVELLEI